MPEKIEISFSAENESDPRAGGWRSKVSIKRKNMEKINISNRYRKEVNEKQLRHKNRC